MLDRFWLYNAPQYANAVQWSDDNLLAVAGGHAVTIFSAAKLDGPRSFLSSKKFDLCAFSIGCKPADVQESAQLALACIAEARSKDVASKLAVRSLSWSPAGADAQGGCLLATVTSDFQVKVSGPVPGPTQSNWEVVADLSQDLKRYLGPIDQEPASTPATTWYAQDHAAGPSTEDQGLRLRGGAGEDPDKSEDPAHGAHLWGQLSVGQLVEVMNNMPGLRGCWFTGHIVDVQWGYVLVEYEELVEEEGDGQLKEWFPLPYPAGQEASLVVTGGHEVHHEGEGSLLRPAPPQKSSHAGCRWSPGAAVDVFHDGGWWQTLVDQLDQDTICATIAGNQQPVRVPLEWVRPTLKWSPEAGWEPSQAIGDEAAAAVLPEASGMGGPREDGASTLPAMWTGPTTRRRKVRPSVRNFASSSQKHEYEGGLSAMSSSSASEHEADQGEEEEEEEEVMVKRTRKKARKRSGGGGPEAPLDDNSIGAAHEGAPSRTPKKARRARGSGYDSYVVPEDFDPEVWRATFPELAALCTQAEWEQHGARAMYRRFMALREQVPADLLPSYSKGEWLKEADEDMFGQVVAEFRHVCGERLSQGNIAEAPLLTKARAMVRKYCIQTFSPYLRSDLSTPGLYHPAGRGSSSRKKNPPQRDEGAVSAGGAPCTPATPLEVPSPGPRGPSGRGGRGRQKNARKDSRGAQGLPSPQTVAQPSLVSHNWSNLETTPPLDTPGGSQWPLDRPSGSRPSQGAGQASDLNYGISIDPHTAGGPSIKLTFVGPRVHNRSKKGDLEGGPLEVCRGPVVPTAVYDRRILTMRVTLVAWSPSCLVAPSARDEPVNGDFGPDPPNLCPDPLRCCFLAAGNALGEVILWRCEYPSYYHPKGGPGATPKLTIVGKVPTHSAGLSCLAWVVLPKDLSQPAIGCGTTARDGDWLGLVTGSTAGELKLWGSPLSSLGAQEVTLQALAVIRGPDERPVVSCDVCVVPQYLEPRESTSKEGPQGAEVPQQPVNDHEGELSRQEPQVEASSHLAPPPCAPPVVLVVAAAMSMGSVFIWQSDNLRPGPEVAASCVDGSVTSHYLDGVHGVYMVTGVVIDPWEKVVTSSGLDGRICSWRLNDGGQLEVVPLPERLCPSSPGGVSPLVPLSRLSSKPVYGLVSSGNRLVTALVRSLDLQETEAQTLQMVYTKVVAATLELLTRYPHQGPHQGPPTTVIRQLAGQSQPLSASQLWDLAAVTVQLPKSMPTPSSTQPETALSGDLGEGAKLEEDAEEEGPGPVVRSKEEKTIDEERARAIEEKLEAVVRVLEAEYLQLETAWGQLVTQGVQAGGLPGSFTFFPHSSPSTWINLQTATALRHLVRTLGKLPAPQISNGDTSKLVQMPLYRNEMLLLQHHLYEVLSQGMASVSSEFLPRMEGTGPAEALPSEIAAAEELSRLLMADWVSLHVRDPYLKAEDLLPLAAQVYVRTGTQPPVNGPSPSREVSLFSGLPVALSGDMVQSAKEATVQVMDGGDFMHIPRCGCSLLLCQTEGVWACRVCGRRYLHCPDRHPAGAQPGLSRCVFCGVRLGIPTGREMLGAPGL